MTFVEARISNPVSRGNGRASSKPPLHYKEMRFLVDTGAYLSMIPSPVLRGLGIQPFTRRRFRLANGRHIWRQVGTARFCIGRCIGEAEVIFGGEKDEPLLGVVTLESLGLAVDPRTKKLKPTEMYLMSLLEYEK